jgi:hypothetical protein
MWTINFIAKRAKCKQKEIKIIQYKFEKVIIQKYSKDLEYKKRFKQSSR